MRNDCPCGSTIGPAIASLTGIRTVDVGIASLSMHSIRETIGIADIESNLKLFKIFYKNFRESLSLALSLTRSLSHSLRLCFLFVVGVALVALAACSPLPSCPPLPPPYLSTSASPSHLDIYIAAWSSCGGVPHRALSSCGGMPHRAPANELPHRALGLHLAWLIEHFACLTSRMQHVPTHVSCRSTCLGVALSTTLHVPRQHVPMRASVHDARAALARPARGLLHGSETCSSDVAHGCWSRG